jgi:3-hydroxyacyl-CoA dehydrogenase/enoyl-CoA hydratase/3-hydroxybutyryl-CoA epimerase
MPKAFSLHIHEDGVAELVFDAEEKSVNVFSSETAAEFEAVLENLERDRHLKALLFRSAKESFIVGADVKEIYALEAAAEAAEKCARGQRLFDRFARLRYPTVAAVHGLCLGGGTELALACTSRVLSDSPSTRMGFPEILLGLAPGWGGTQRLARLVGLPRALELVLTGKKVAAEQALRMGLADAVFPEAIFPEESLKFIRDEVLRRGKLPARRRTRVVNHPFVRPLIAAAARRRTMKRTRGHYPAALEAVRLCAKSLSWPIERGLAEEAHAVGHLIAGPVCKNLMRLFFLREEAEKLRIDGAEPPPVERVGVAGAGVMGGGIAQLAAYKGCAVRLKDVREDALTRALRTARGLFEDKREHRSITSAEVERGLARIMPTLRYDGFARADLVVEAAVERMDVKKQIFSELERVVSRRCVLASNTSALPVTEMARGLRHPERVVGLHFFNPVHKTPLVEVVRGEESSDGAVAAAVSFAQRLGKTPVVVKDSFGFLVNRLLMPYLMEAALMVEEGFSLQAVDEAALAFGMPMGPLALFDEMGIDVAHHMGGTMRAAFPGRFAESKLLDTLYEEKHLGKRTGRGFYVHKGRRKRPARLPFAASGKKPRKEDIVPRLFHPVVNEAARCLAEGVAARAEDVDLAMAMGAGFAPFRSGPLRWAGTVGFSTIVGELERLAERHGPRFEPSAALREMAGSGEPRP